MSINGHFNDGRQTRAWPAALHVSDGQQVSVVTEDGVECVAPTPLRALRASSRLGNTPRHLYFPDGTSFTTEDNEAVDRLWAHAHPRAGFVHRLESRWRAIALALVVTVSVVFSGLYWGVPAGARYIAFQLPVSVNLETERLALQVLDRSAFRSSRLEADERERLLERFQPLMDASETGGLPLRVEFRDASHSFGANALALPGGTIVFTDQLVRLARNDDELVAILAHEIGHIVERHAMRRTVQASALSVAAILLMGDVSSVAGAAASLPIILTESGYSRAFEREADRHAVQLLHAHGVAPQRLAEILHRLDPGDDGPGYLSTHPPTPERMRNIERDAAALR